MKKVYLVGIDEYGSKYPKVMNDEFENAQEMVEKIRNAKRSEYLEILKQHIKYECEFKIINLINDGARISFTDIFTNNRVLYIEEI